VVVVSDTSPVSGLYRINHLFVLERLFGKVILPNAVFQEILELRSFGYDLKEILTAEWIEVRSAADVSAVEYLLHHLDLGEAEAIVIAKELQADLLVMDESKGRALAKLPNLFIHHAQAFYIPLEHLQSGMAEAPHGAFHVHAVFLGGRRLGGVRFAWEQLLKLKQKAPFRIFETRLLFVWRRQVDRARDGSRRG
jgi:predicted nucleic acid-binding protein